MAFPTLCYQISFPRSPHRLRKRWLLLRIGELAAVLLAMYIIIEQYMQPTIENARKHVVENEGAVHLSYMLERLLKLAIPSLYVWLLFFFSFFHLHLNILAELTHFGDRLFYRDWWNARDIEEYW